MKDLAAVLELVRVMMSLLPPGRITRIVMNKRLSSWNILGVPNDVGFEVNDETTPFLRGSVRV